MKLMAELMMGTDTRFLMKPADDNRHGNFQWKFLPAASSIPFSRMAISTQPYLDLISARQLNAHKLWNQVSKISPKSLSQSIRITDRLENLQRNRNNPRK